MATKIKLKFTDCNGKYHELEDIEEVTVQIESNATRLDMTVGDKRTFPVVLHFDHGTPESKYEAYFVRELKQRLTS